jgi:hypothetical protein
MILKYFIAWFGMMLLAQRWFSRFRIQAPRWRSSRTSDFNPHTSDSVYSIYVVFGQHVAHRVCQPSVDNRRNVVLMTEAFEFGVGRLIVGDPWSKLFQAYNLFAGKVWLFIPLWVLLGPYVFFRHVQPK